MSDNQFNLASWLGLAAFVGSAVAMFATDVPTKLSKRTGGHAGDMIPIVMLMSTAIGGAVFYVLKP